MSTTRSKSASWTPRPSTSSCRSCSGYLIDRVGAQGKTAGLAEWLTEQRPRRTLLRQTGAPSAPCLCHIVPAPDSDVLVLSGFINRTTVFDPFSGQTRTIHDLGRRQGPPPPVDGGAAPPPTDGGRAPRSVHDLVWA